MCVPGLYLDGDASVLTGHVNVVWLSIGQVALVHIYCKRLPQTAEVIPDLQ